MKLLKPSTFGIMALAAVMYACGDGGGDSARKETTSSIPQNEPKKAASFEEQHGENPDYVKGLALIKDSDCPSCHMAERKIVGPSYAEVAERYENNEENINLLASRVIKGAVGEWGDVPMPAHPGLSEEDARQMIKYVLLLRR
ncbi:c-type cytochrome [Litoribacter alkaliphilus]|uniref:C-type cytochrome n=1 Tax=Litoribacter ruber TaxID=702568 RepID=A0AAP2G100_9BACT|nr:c-type cytochrome [Litoribacter alkaliphilus]MBS9523774.1 c-type cytochrome [Litoribacter alkaliphilus]